MRRTASGRPRDRASAHRHAPRQVRQRGADRPRPAAQPRGRRDARRVAEQIVSLGWTPDRVVASDSARTLETWERMLEGLTLPIPMSSTPLLYHAGPDAFLEVVGRLPEEVRLPLVLGHNPGWEQVVAWLTGELVPMGTAHAVLLVRADPGPRGAPRSRRGLRDRTGDRPLTVARCVRGNSTFDLCRTEAFRRAGASDYHPWTESELHIHLPTP
ncbi:MAG: histidine phosphatase family protein [Myxococcota bacterium]